MIKIRRRWTGNVVRIGLKRSAYTVLMGKPEGGRPLGRRRLRWKDNVKIYLRKDAVVRTGLIRLRIGTSIWLL
jgi:hypothetical protein